MYREMSTFGVHLVVLLLLRNNKTLWLCIGGGAEMEGDKDEMVSNLWDILIALVLQEYNGGGELIYGIRCRLAQTLSEYMGYVTRILVEQIDNIVKNAMEYYDNDIEKQHEIGNKIVADLMELKELYMLAFEKKKNAE